MWFHTNFFVPPKQFKFDGEEIEIKETSFTISGEGKIKEGSFTFSGEGKD